MKTALLIEKELLFKENVRLTAVKEYGYSWSELAEGKSPIPPEGARFDISFEGDLIGDRINGTIKGIDYLEVRADGHFILNLQACITTDDGVDIKVTESGVNNQGNLRLNIAFHTSDKRYTWLNQSQVWGVGEVNFKTGEAKVKGYLI
jgi:hypothetical protein